MMETARCLQWGFLFLLLQVFSSAFAELSCSPGFDSQLFIFKVHREHLNRGKRLGKVIFSDCSGRSHMVFDSADKRFEVTTEGTVKLKRLVTLHEGHKMFSIHAWDSTGKRHTAYVRVEHEGGRDRPHDQQENTEAVGPEQTEYPSTVFFLEFPKSSGGLKRRKREWVIPAINLLENDRGPFPKKMVQIKSSIAKETPVWFSITGEGADLPPKGIFSVDRSTGWLYCSMPLDREKKDKYVLQAHAFSQDGSIKEQPLEIIINVIDIDYNEPFFIQDQFIGSVPEASTIGFEIMTVTATDADDPNTDNTDLRYSILSQIPAQPNPNMFTINPVSGAILVASEGLDREKYPEYTLEIQVADQKGDGFTAKAKAIITVTDSNDNAPQFEKTSYSVSVPENKVGALVVKLAVTDGDEPQSPAWAAKFRIVGGNSGGFFNISTGPNKQEGIITTVKPLDFERNSTYTLLLIAENEVQFAKPLPTSTATVIVNVTDVIEINFPENDVGPFPKMMVQIKSIIAKETPVWYSITGEGADLPPKGLFTVDKRTGWVYVTTTMDREAKNAYILQTHAVSQDGSITEPPMEIIINMIDMNDNKPFFTQDKFLGSVPEASKIGFEIMTVTATDADDPNTDNADLKYTIVTQIPAQPNPNMFTINPVSGTILVNSEGLNREKYPQYTLEIQAADMQGNGFTTTGQAVITVTDSSLIL